MEETHYLIPAVPTLERPPSVATGFLEGTSLFIDFDGTLIDIADRPDDVIVDQEIRVLLTALACRHGDRVALVSGRSLAQLDALLGTIASNFALSGSHGAEFRWNGSYVSPERPQALDEAEARLRDAASLHSGTSVEIKTCGVALHYRMSPSSADWARLTATRIAEDLGLVRQLGKMMVEIRLPGDKGTALRTLMKRPEMAGTRPVFLGDDLTDEPAFEAAHALGGSGILVGPPRPTAARYGLAHPSDVRRWLSGVGA